MNELKIRFDRRFNVIRIGQYEVDLDRMQTPAAVLDWIFHVQHKSWMTPELFSRFIQLLKDVLDETRPDLMNQIYCRMVGAAAL